MRQCYGALPDIADPRDARHPVRELVGTPRVPAAVDWSQHIPFITDQEGESCVGEMWRRMLHLRAAISRRPILWPSALGVYTLASQKGGTFPADMGCRPRDAADVLMAWGICAEHRWPSVRANVGQELPWDVYTAGADARLERYSRLLSSGEERCAEIRQALAAGFPVGFAQSVDRAYEDGPGRVWDGLRGEPLGRHAQVIVGYRPGAFLVVNSWSVLWNVDGYVWVTDRHMGSDDVADLYVGDVTVEDVS